MGLYSRNASFLQSPQPNNRHGRFKVAGSVSVRQFAPVVWDGNPRDALGRAGVVFGASAAVPSPALSGLLIFEDPYTAYYDHDPAVTTAEDLDIIAVGKAPQVVHGTDVRFRLVNTVDIEFEGQRDYPGYTIVTMTGLAIGSLLKCAGPTTTADPMFNKTTTASQAWAVVTDIDTAVNGGAGAVEAQLLF